MGFRHWGENALGKGGRDVCRWIDGISTNGKGGWDCYGDDGDDDDTQGE